MKVLFMGTPDFAAGILKAIVESGHEVVCVVTQEDKMKGRSDKLVPPPVKEYALSKGLTVMQPYRIKDESEISKLKEYDADIYVVSAFGQILSKEILEIPKYGCINTHASLLPKLRGAAPIQWAILNGDKTTGVTIMQMDEGVDTGDILFAKEVDILDTDTGESLFDKLADTGAALIVDALDNIEKGNVNPVKQDESKATHVGMLKKQMGLIDFAKSAVSIERKVRAFYPWPGTFTYYKGKMLKIFASSLYTPGNELSTRTINQAKPGMVLLADSEQVVIKTGDGLLAVHELQLEGKKRMPVKDFLLGCKIEVGELLGEMP